MNVEGLALVATVGTTGLHVRDVLDIRRGTHLSSGSCLEHVRQISSYMGSTASRERGGDGALSGRENVEALGRRAGGLDWCLNMGTAQEEWKFHKL